jgi:hypothetical protein
VKKTILFFVLYVLYVALFVALSRRTQSLLTGSAVRGEALKERSEGSWRSGRRRSGDVGGGGTVDDFRVPCRAAIHSARAMPECVLRSEIID